MRKRLMVALTLVGVAAGQNYDSESWHYASPIAGFSSGVVLLECPFLEHPEYASEVTCIETHVTTQEARVGIDKALDPLFGRAWQDMTREYQARNRTGWQEMQGGYLMRGWPLGGGPWLRVEVHDMGDSRLITIYALD